MADMEIAIVNTNVEGQQAFYRKFGCWYNAFYNQQTAYQHIKGLKVVIGTCFESEQGGWGYKDCGGRKVPYENLKEWKASRAGGNKGDAHVWLEDEKGKVYDYDWFNHRHIFGEDKKVLKQKWNITYKVADEDSTKYLWNELAIDVKGAAVTLLHKNGFDYIRICELIRDSSPAKLILAWKYKEDKVEWMTTSQAKEWLVKTMKENKMTFLQKENPSLKVTDWLRVAEDSLTLIEMKTIKATA